MKQRDILAEQKRKERIERMRKLLSLVEQGERPKRAAWLAGVPVRTANRWRQQTRANG